MPVLPLVGSISTVSPGLILALPLGGFNHGEADAVLHAVYGVCAFQLRNHASMRAFRDPVQLHKWRVSDQIRNAGCNLHALILKYLLSFRLMNMSRNSAQPV